MDNILILVSNVQGDNMTKLPYNDKVSPTSNGSPDKTRI